LLEKLIVARLVKEFPISDWTGRFNCRVQGNQLLKSNV